MAQFVLSIIEPEVFKALHLMGCNSINIVPARQFDPLLQISSTKDLHLDPAILDSDFQQPASNFAHEC